jgi:hypothetical protein
MTDWKALPPYTRAWIYQATRELTENEAAEIRQLADAFADQWTAHGKAMRAAIEIFYNRFIIVFADESQAMASGCSIDSSVRFIKDLENKYNIPLLDHMHIAYKQDGKVLSAHLSGFKTMLQQGILDENTIVFNNLVTTKADIEKNWEVPVKDSWHKQLVS